MNIDTLINIFVAACFAIATVLIVVGYRMQGGRGE